MSTGSVNDLSSGGATLLGSFSGATGTVYASGFVWGEDEENLNNDIQLGSQVGSSGSLDFFLDGLTASKTYYYQAYVQVWDTATSTAVLCYGEVRSFTTGKASDFTPSGWLELPATTGNEDYVGAFYGSGGNTDANRNYSYNYSYTYYASLWTAYPLSYSHKSGNPSSHNWIYNPNITNYTYQVKVRTSDGSYTSMYGNSAYSRGHQIPNADRLSDDTMNAQTYYVTNQTPQLQEKFNGSIWGSLETAVRNLVTQDGEVVYVVTGPVYRKVGGSETINYLTGASGKNANPASLPIPNYYWKAILKVKYTRNEITRASAIGFWLNHREYTTSESFTNYVVSVDQIEAWTGFDLFTNLPGTNSAGIEKAAESNTSWQTFQNF